MARHRFPGERRRVKLACALHDHAVDGHALAGLHDDDAARRNLARVDLFYLTVSFYVGVIGRDVHHGGDGFAAFTHRIALEQLSYLIEQHYRAAFRHARLGLGECHHRKGADGGHGHEEVLVEHLTRDDVAPSAREDVVPCNEVRHQVEHEQQVYRACGAKPLFEWQHVVDGENDREQGERDNDAVSPLSLLLVHGSCNLTFV